MSTTENGDPIAARKPKLVVSNDDAFLSSRARFRSARRVKIDELFGRDIPPKIAWSAEFDGFTVECRRRRYWKREATFEYASRNIMIRLLSRGQVCGVAEFVEWKSDGLADGDELFYELDGLSSEDSDTASTILSCWEDGNLPFDYGTVVRFDRLGIAAGPHVSRLALSSLRQAIDREFGKRGSVLILKAFPLEFEWEAKTSKQEKLLADRQRAMVRHYGARLGTRPLPGKLGEDGWLWMPLRYCPEPELTALGL